MARYQRGQVCGVDNCPSRLWKRVDGRNVCQYGHVNEFDIEIDDEDDAFSNTAGGGGAGGGFNKRLLNVQGLTASHLMNSKVDQLSVEKKVQRKYGEDYKLLQVKCFQIILCKNTKFIIEELKFTKVNAEYYKTIVKGLWIKLLKMSVDKELENKSRDYDIGHLVIINYLAMVEMNLPLSLEDFIRITYKKKFNIERSEYCLPRSLRIQIPISKLSSFHGHLNYDYVANLRRRFCTSYIGSNLQDSKLNYFPIMVRKLVQKQLPLEIAILVKNYVDKHNIEFKFTTLLGKYQPHPEEILEEIMGKMESAYLSISDKEHPKTIIEVREAQFTDLRNRITHKTGFVDLLQWTDEQISEYATYYSQNVLPNIHSTNIASSNEYKDRNSLQIAQALLGCFPETPVTR